MWLHLSYALHSFLYCTLSSSPLLVWGSYGFPLYINPTFLLNSTIVVFLSYSSMCVISRGQSQDRIQRWWIIRHCCGVCEPSMILLRSAKSLPYNRVCLQRAKESF